MQFTEWSDNQRRIYIDTAQAYDAFSDALRKSRAYRGGMHWKKAKGREYLFKTTDRYGYGKSLGPRSPETEQILTDFRAKKAEIRDRLNALKTRLAEQARFCRAARIQRVPRLVTAILRLLDERRMLGKNVIVAGTHAIYSYEAGAGVFMDAPLLATRDVDILWDIRPRLKLAGTDDSGLLGILQKADRSFEPLGKEVFRAANKDGFLVDLIKSEPRSVVTKERRRMGAKGDLEAAEIRNLQWLVSSPKYTQTVIGDDGFPARMIAPDPRAFALHKLWLSRRKDREPVKQRRDREQAEAVARLVIRHLPDLPFNPTELRMFPRELMERYGEWMSEGGEMPVGFDF